MYQKHFDMLYKLKLHQRLIDEFREELKEVKVTNSIEQYYGKTYLRVYIELIIKEESSRKREFWETYDKTIFGWTNENYISFYLPDFKRSKEQLENREESSNYDWIVNILEFGSWGHHAPKFSIAPFRSLLDKEREDEKLSQEFEKKRSQVLNSLKDNTPLRKNQLIVVKDYSSFRLGRLKEMGERIRLGSSLRLVEVKKDLTNGAREILYVNMYDIYAIIDPFELEKKVDKTSILAWVDRKESFKGLIYLRPPNLW